MWSRSRTEKRSPLFLAVAPEASMKPSNVDISPRRPFCRSDSRDHASHMRTFTFLPGAAALALVLGLGLGLGGCVTHRSEPVASRAVLEARAHRGAPTPATCGALASPVSVGFAFGEPSLNEYAVPALESAGQQLACHPEVGVLVVGQSDGHGTVADQKTLAQARAEAVAKDLRARGVAAGRIQVQVEGAAPAGDARRLVVLAEGRRW